MKTKVSISLLAAGAALLAGTAQADKWSDQFPHIKNTGDIAGECSYESMSQKDYSGQKQPAKHGDPFPAYLPSSVRRGRFASEATCPVHMMPCHYAAKLCGSRGSELDECQARGPFQHA